jgi:Protein of unknown function (DUF3037)
MPGNHLFEYAVIRVVPRVEREEFLNVGVILYCQDLKFLQTKFSVDHQRLLAFFPGLDLEELREHLCAFEKISLGATDGGPIARLDLPLRFRWLTAARSTIVQTSKVHPGLCINAEETLMKLHQQLVG